MAASVEPDLVTAKGKDVAFDETSGDRPSRDEEDGLEDPEEVAKIEKVYRYVELCSTTVHLAIPACSIITFD